MPEKYSLLLKDQICFSLYSASLAMTQLYKPLLEPLGLTYTQYLILLILWEKDGIGLKDIGARLGQKSGALTPVIRRLEKDGLILRQRLPEDERSLHVSLTPKGHALRQDALKVNQCILDSCAIDVQELSDLKGKIDKLKDKLVVPPK